jgi:hypothetical protein
VHDSLPNQSIDDYKQPPELLKLLQEQMLHAELTAIHEDLSNLYLGAKYALLHEDNPDCLRQAAVSVRELIKALPSKDSRMPAPSKRIRMSDERLNQLALRWKPIMAIVDEPVAKIACQKPKKLKQYLDESKDFFEWRRSSSKLTRERHQDLFDTYDPKRASLPSDMKEQVIDRWMDYSRYFNSVAHEELTNIEVFTNQLQGFEDLLLRLLQPPSLVIDDFLAIDEIIFGVEHG